jgi:hypothetical protein
VADKLFSSFGQDILDALFWTATEPRGRKREHLGVVAHLGMAIVYVCELFNFYFIRPKKTISNFKITLFKVSHSLLVLLQASTLNVAINSRNKALLTVMMSNNVSPELKLIEFSLN